ncbi:kinesin-related protein 11 [Gossypium australe]|uniref:Kinesin-related protein 11 n=1 Tax=Gossypium australe TaxID=47621 RepID=A0A5B6VFS0_9ROSI|nr:kinesin-related protein 11 [Gossypium australe]
MDYSYPARSSSPLSYRKSSSFSSTSSTSSFFSNKPMHHMSSSSSSSFFNSGSEYGSRSMSDSMHYGSQGYSARPPVAYGSDEIIGEPFEASRPGDSISVTIRFRPLNEREFHRGDEIAWYADEDNIVRNEYNPATAYAFDKVFGPQATSQEVYEVAAKPVVKAAMEGVNGTVFAYGVTSSGKTHTMHGDQNAPGIIPLAIKDVFSIIQDTSGQDSYSTPGREFLLRVSYLEIYNEVINDLLDPTGQNLRVREDAQGTYIEGVKEEVVLSPGHALSFIAAGEEHRHVGSNNFNLFSSRSHTIFTLMIESSARGDEYDGNLIDLAGSESSKTDTTGIRRKEGSYINKSLLTLGTVIGKLSEGKACHVPYRDSKLTRLLQSSLSGHGLVSLICTVTPASSNMEETHNTLKFASRAKRVEIYASRNKIIDEKSLIKKYQREISVLKEELDRLRKGMVVGVNHEELLSLKQQLEEGQVKMQSRLEEEEEAKAALMSRIQRLTKLILVSTKTTIPGSLSDLPSHQRRHSVGEEDQKLDLRVGDTLLIDDENQKDSPSLVSALVTEPCYEFKHRRSSSRRNDEFSPASRTFTESTQAGELITGIKPLAVQLSEEASGLRVQNQKLAEEASYAKELASAAAVELKSLAGEVTKLSVQNGKLEKELIAARELAHSRSFANSTFNGVNRKYNDSMRSGRKGRLSGRSQDFSVAVGDDFESWNLDLDDLKMELQARKQQEAALKAALAEKELIEDEYRKKVEEAKKREETLENDLANMWVLVAKLKKGGAAATLDSNTDEPHSNGTDNIEDPKANNIESNNVLKERQVSEVPSKPANERPKEEPLVVRLKHVCSRFKTKLGLHLQARMQEMKEKELKSLGNGDTNSYIL